MKQPPKRFKIDLDVFGKTPFSMQIAAALKDAILRHVWRTGEVLPSINELAALAHVGVKVPRRALEIMAEEGWAVPLRGIGSVVADRGLDAQDKGRILAIGSRTGYSYYASAFMDTLGRCVLAHGYRPTFLNNVVLNGSVDVKRLRMALEEKWELVILVGGTDKVRQIVADANRSFVLIGDGAPLPRLSAPSCVGRIEVKCGKAVPDLIRACARSRIRSVVQFIYDAGSFDASEMLATAAIATESVRIGEMPSLDGVSLAALAKMRSLLSGKSLPDLFLFTDDFVAQGGLLALALAGKRVPDDVRVATQSNKGFGPVWPKELTRLEMDPFAHAREASDAIVSYLESGSFPSGLELGSVWMPGKTF